MSPDIRRFPDHSRLLRELAADRDVKRGAPLWRISACSRRSDRTKSNDWGKPFHVEIALCGIERCFVTRSADFTAGESNITYILKRLLVGDDTLVFNMRFVRRMTDGARVVLVAEDDVLVRNLINTVLIRAGYAVLLASNGEEALELSRRYTGDIHLLLSDVMMPRMDGLELAARLREERPAVPALLVSGRLSSELIEGNCYFDFLRKPFVPDQLRLKLEEILRRSATNRVEEI